MLTFRQPQSAPLRFTACGVSCRLGFGDGVATPGDEVCSRREPQEIHAEGRISDSWIEHLEIAIGAQRNGNGFVDMTPDYRDR